MPFPFSNKDQSTSFLRTYTILWLALVESAAIYAFVVSFQILWAVGLDPMSAIGAGLVMWLTAFWAGLFEGKLVAGALEAINRNP